MNKLKVAYSIFLMFSISSFTGFGYFYFGVGSGNLFNRSLFMIAQLISYALASGTFGLLLLYHLAHVKNQKGGTNQNGKYQKQKLARKLKTRRSR